MPGCSKTQSARLKINPDDSVWAPFARIRIVARFDSEAKSGHVYADDSVFATIQETHVSWHAR